MNLQETLLSQLRRDKTIEYINLTLSDGHAAYGSFHWEDGENVALVRMDGNEQYEYVIPLCSVVRYNLRRRVQETT